MKILLLSWRDIRHPNEGGAERLAHEMMKRWVKMGHKVSHFSAKFPGGSTREMIDGVEYIRKGNWYDVHLRAFISYIRGNLGRPDVVIDEVHGIPFFAKIYTSVPVVCHACEVAKNVWDEMYGFPFNIIGKVVERIYLLYYKDTPFLTISKSTKQDLVDNGVNEKKIVILPMGFNYTLPTNLPKKTKYPTIIFLGRLARSKGIPDAIEAFTKIKKSFPDSKMLVVGKGDPKYEKQLKKLVKDRRLSKSVEFKGFVSEPEKFRLLAKSHLILVPSAREGWGLIVPEANVVGTPAVVYDVPGLRDVTKNGINGRIVKENNPNELARESIKMLNNTIKYKKLSETSKVFAKSMNWDNTADIAIKLLEKIKRANE